MAEIPGGIEGITATLAHAVGAVTLRYLSPTSGFAATLARAGLTVPEPGHARQAGALVLLSVRPTETLCIATAPDALRALTGIEEASDGCLIELTGALDLVRLEGTRCAELLARLGGQGTVPAPGEARRSRMADVPVLAVALEAGACSLLVDRTLTEHLTGWIAATLADFAAAPPGRAP